VLALVSTTDSQQFSPAITISANARYIFPKYQPNSVVGCSIVIIAASRSRGPEGTERADAGSGTPELGNNAVMICGLLLSHALFEIAMAIAVRTNAHKVRRRRAGRARNGLSGGGIRYGYAPLPGRWAGA